MSSGQQATHEARANLRTGGFVHGTFVTWSMDGVTWFLVLCSLRGNVGTEFWRHDNAYFVLEPSSLPVCLIFARSAAHDENNAISTLTAVCEPQASIVFFRGGRDGWHEGGRPPPVCVPRPVCWWCSAAPCMHANTVHPTFSATNLQTRFYSKCLMRHWGRIFFW